MLMGGIPSSRRRSMSMLTLLLVAVATVAIGCGAGQSPQIVQAIPATTAGSYVFTVSGTDLANPAITTSTTVTVTVQ
jgi:hypothetical protein